MAVLTIYPYLLDSTWVFDDPQTCLKAEAFVCGATEMISKLVEMKGLLNAAKGFEMHFSDQPFEDFDAELHWLRSDDEQFGLGGNWYSGTLAGEELECWLCPALFCYFESAPERIYVRANPLPAGVDPIWRDGSQGTRFVGPGGEPQH